MRPAALSNPSWEATPDEPMNHPLRIKSSSSNLIPLWPLAALVRPMKSTPQGPFIR